MSEEPELGFLDQLSMKLHQINDLAHEAQRIMMKLGEDQPQEIWDHAISEVKRGIAITCESTMDGFLLVELVDNGETIIKSERFDLFEAFSQSAFVAATLKDRDTAIETLKRVLAFMEGHTPSNQ